MAFKNEEELNKAFEAAKASLEIEGMTVTKEMEKIIKEKVAGKITHEQLLILADAIARRERT
ncbi:MULTISPECIES: antitoxin VbhA family protein [Bacillus]|uniref:antitoxin VbhA family protein n=1 Tax=Bacillus TaxID=1386 RepID=UPI001BB4535F|nr:MULTISPECIES: antitoxin VbhA family protein [Bacillus]